MTAAAVSRYAVLPDGRLAFEYEIWNEPGVVLAFDVVTVTPLTGETAASVLPLIQEYLTQRCAKWALSDTPEKVARRKETFVGERLAEGEDAGGTLYVSVSPDEALAMQRMPRYDFYLATPEEKAEIKAARGTPEYAGLAAPFLAGYVEAFEV